MVVAAEEKQRRRALEREILRERLVALKEKKQRERWFDEIMERLEGVKHHSPEVQQQAREAQVGELAEKIGLPIAKALEKMAEKEKEAAEEEKKAAEKEEKEEKEEMELEKEKMKLVKEEEKEEKEKEKLEREKEAARKGVYDAIILLVAASLGFVFNHFVFGWMPVGSFIISMITFGVFLKFFNTRYAIAMILIDVASLTLIEAAPAWGLISVLILIRMGMWMAVALATFVYRWLKAKRKGIIPTVLMFVVIGIALLIVLPKMNTLWGMHVHEHEEKYDEAYRLAAKSTEVVIKQANESASAVKRTVSALWCLAIKGDIPCYNRIMHPPPPEKDISGEEDKTIKEYTKVEFVKPEGFPTEIQQAFPQAIPIQLNAESPQKEIKIDLSCRFKRAGNESEGVVKPKKSYLIKKPEQITLTCSNPYEFDVGPHYVIFEARIDDIETESRLRRLFVGKEMTQRRIKELMKLHLLSSDEPSRSADEFAAFSFGVGTPFTNPILKDEEEQPILGNIVNKANGVITGIKRISVGLPEDIGVDPSGCGDFRVYGNELVFENEEKLGQIDWSKVKTDEKVSLLGCFLTIPEELRNTEVAKERSFKSMLEYSYKIETKLAFKVRPRLNFTG